MGSSFVIQIPLKKDSGEVLSAGRFVVLTARVWWWRNRHCWDVIQIEYFGVGWWGKESQGTYPFFGFVSQWTVSEKQSHDLGWFSSAMHCGTRISFSGEGSSSSARSVLSWRMMWNSSCLFSIVAVLENKVYIYNFADLKLVDQIDTYSNPSGTRERMKDILTLTIIRIVRSECDEGWHGHGMSWRRCWWSSSWPLRQESDTHHRRSQ